jgi:hypothetical protein
MPCLIRQDHHPDSALDAQSGSRGKFNQVA